MLRIHRRLFLLFHVQFNDLLGTIPAEGVNGLDSREVLSYIVSNHAGNRDKISADITRWYDGVLEVDQWKSVGDRKPSAFSPAAAGRGRGRGGLAPRGGLSAGVGRGGSLPRYVPCQLAVATLCAVLSLPITKECSPIPVQTPALHVDSFFHCVCIADLVSVVVLPLLYRLSSPLHPQLARHPQRLLPPPLHPCQWHVHAHSHPPVLALTRLAPLLPGHHKQPHRPVARPHLLLRHEPLHLHLHPSRLAQPGAPPVACKPS